MKRMTGRTQSLGPSDRTLRYESDTLYVYDSDTLRTQNVNEKNVLRITDVERII